MNKDPTFVAKIDPQLAEKLKTDLLEQGFTLTNPPYTLFSAKKGALSVTLYTSGKLLVQGKDKEPFITYYLEPEILQTFNYSHPEVYVDLRPRIGIDEAGKGDFFGPLCIAGVYADEEGIKKLLKMSVRDSKRMSDKNVLKMATEIKAHFSFALVNIFPQKYNELYERFKNLNYLLAWGHATAIETLVEKTSCTYAIIDQFANERVVEEAIARKKLTIQLTQRHRGEEDPVVAAASILARASFLEGLEKLCVEHDCILPKGASQEVIRAGKALIAKWGREILPKVAKLHFKTLNELD